MMAPDFLKLNLDNRRDHIPEWASLAKKHGFKLVFWGLTMGVKEQAVFVFESNYNSEKFFKFQREWIKLGTPEAVKLIENMRTITVH
jgi:hypothetical protein